MNSRPDLRIAQWNVRSLPTRLPDLCHLLTAVRPHVLLLCETFLHPAKTCKIPGFLLVRKDRPGLDHHGGVAIAVRQDIPFRQVPLPDTDVEAVAAQLVLPNGRLSLLSLYLPPGLNTDRAAAFRQLTSRLEPPVLIGGDFNAKHQAWGSPADCAKGTATFDSLVSNHGLHLLNDGSPTYLPPHFRPSHLDLSFCSSSLSLRASWRTLSSSASDHLPVMTTLAGMAPRDPVFSRPPPPASVDWPAFSRAVSSSLPSLPPSSAPLPPSSSLDLRVQSLAGSFSSASSLFLPRHRVPVRPRLPPWWNASVRKAVADRNAARHRALRSSCPQLSLAYRKAYARARHVMREARKAQWRTLCSSLSSSSSLSWVWRMAKGAPPRSAIPPLSDPLSGSLAVSARDRASLLLQAFFPPSHPCPRAISFLQEIPFSYVGDTTDLNQPFTPGELEKVLSSVRSGSPGSDRVTYTMLKQLDHQAKLHLLSVFNESFLTGTCPAAWKLAEVSPLRKPAKPATDPAGYRPISLLSCIGKVMERLVLRRLLWHMESHRLSCPNQYGFKAGHSTVEPLVHLVSDAKRSILDRSYTVVVFLDIKKAFDGVWHEAVLAKLRLAGVSGPLYSWISSFLSDRTYQLRVEGEAAETQPSVGVPQGSPLSPRLFNLVMDGLAEVLPEQVTPALFADDGNFWTTAPTLPVALDRIQQALDSLGEYGDLWGLDISSEKTDFMVIGPRGRRNSQPAALSLKGRPIPRVRCKRILGLHLNDRLTWGDHVKYLRAKCGKVTSLLRCLSGTSWGSERRCLLQVYKALILSRVNYAAPAWPDLPDQLRASLEVIQNSALRAITHLPSNTAVAALQVEANLPPLDLQRELLTVSFFLKLKARFNPLLVSISRPLNWWWMFGQRDPVSVCTDALENWHVPTLLDQVDPEFLTSRLPPWSEGHPSVTFVTDWLDRPKGTLPEDHLRALALEQMSQHPADALVFTDGSRASDTSRCGLGVYWPRDGNSVSHRLSEVLCITSVELYAILFAVRGTPSADTVLVCSDSLAALTLLQDHSEPSTLVRDILSEATSRFKSTTFLWVPSHCGIPGNEAADRAAKAALDLPVITEVTLPRRDAVRHLRQLSYNSWSARWASGTTGRVLFQVKPTPGPWTYTAALSKQEAFILTAIRCGRARVPEYQHRIEAAPSEDCPACGTLGDTSHVLLHCPLYDHHRQTLQRELAALGAPVTLATLLGGSDLPPVPSGKAVLATLKFLKESGLFSTLR